MISGCVFHAVCCHSKMTIRQYDIDKAFLNGVLYTDKCVLLLRVTTWTSVKLSISGEFYVDQNRLLQHGIRQFQSVSEIESGAMCIGPVRPSRWKPFVDLRVAVCLQYDEREAFLLIILTNLQMK